jgi:wyosine [tRNA(Phe)-imidazoG37] synthetase (radical SAM superfamily)
MSIPLQKGIIYGPVHSRRIGRSLGINLLPTEFKLCAFDCVYCQYGKTDIKTISPQEDLLPSIEEVAAALEEVLRRIKDLDVITFSGNGEPTLHPRFGEIVSVALELRDRLAPGKPVAVLSSGAMAHRPEVREALNRLDLRIMKLDAGDEQTFQEINRPVAGLGLEEIVEGLRQLDRVILQTLLVKGPRENSSPEKIAKLIERIRVIRPQEVQLYTLIRPPAEEYVAAVPKGELEEIAARIAEEAEVEVKVY